MCGWQFRQYGVQCHGWTSALWVPTPDGQRRCAIFLVHEKVTQGSSKSAEYRAYRRIAPKSLELVLVSQPVAQTFCGRLLLQHLANTAYFDPDTDWPKPIELNATLSIVLEQLAFLGDTRSRRELLVFAQANPAPIGHGHPPARHPGTTHGQ